MKHIAITFIILLFTLIAFVSCRKHQNNAADGNYPPAVAKIFLGKCAISGCHNAASYANAGNLEMDTWEHLFKGSNNGSVVVPFSPQFSPLIYFINTDYSLGPVAQPTMPISTPSQPISALTDEEYDVIQQWILHGAPDKNGNVAFSTNAASRQKIYITNQGCDLVTVVDAETNLVMRYIRSGVDPTITEGPSSILPTADGMSLYMNFVNGNYLQKINAVTDTIATSVDLSGQLSGLTGTNSFVLSDSSVLITMGHTPGGLAGYNLQSTASYNLLNSLWYPYSIAANPSFDSFFVTSQFGNTVYRYANATLALISLDGAAPNTTHTGISPDPHSIISSTDHSKYFVTCQNTNEVRVLDKTGSVIKVIPVGAFPQEMTISSSRNYLFVTCQEDNSNPNPGCKGSVYVIDCNTFSVSKVLYGDFYQPRGIAVDEHFGKVYVVSSNASPTGPPAHHETACGGNAGWYTVFDLNTLEPLDNKRHELMKLPFGASTRFK